MERLDGNAIAGPLMEHFGTEMTIAVGACAHCGATAPMAELHVFARGPGAVVRCPTCAEVVIVLVERSAGIRVDLTAFRLRGAAS